MRVNADFSCRACMNSNDYQWVLSPQNEVERVMLDRCGGEQTRATSLVRYRPGANFPRHMHPGGEEILVLAGVFSDEEGNYRQGFYLRNPPGSSHGPFSQEGALIFVKLWQMAPDEQRHVRIDTRDPAAWRIEGEKEVCLLFQSTSEKVELQRLRPSTSFQSESEAGAEFLVLDGEVLTDSSRFESGSWWRLPPGDRLNFVAGHDGATLYSKTGHLSSMLEPE